MDISPVEPGQAPAEEAQARHWHLLEEHRPFADSLLWRLQRSYFNERGVEAWRQEEVPHYITSNPTIARSYADTVFAFYQDRQRLAPSDEALTICELGAGSGRFAFHFLQHLSGLCQSAATPLAAFRYVLTDFTQSNLDAWRRHSHFQAWIAEGLLDIALFDVDHTDTLSLQVSGGQVTAGDLLHPLAVIANYVFDGVPQDLFYFRDGDAYACEVALAVQTDPSELDIAALLEQVQASYQYVPLTSAPYEDEIFQALFDYCRDACDQAHVLFPVPAWRCLARLRALSRSGLLLLSADKGQCRLDAVALAEPPGLARHGSFSINVNYHALLSWGKLAGGEAWWPSHPHRSLAVIALLLVADASAHAATRAAYEQQLAGFGPDDFYTMVRFLNGGIDAMGIEEILAYMRFNRADAHQLIRLMPRLTALAPQAQARDIDELRKMLDRSWDGYFPLGEQYDLAFGIASLLYELDDFQGALTYFSRAEEIYGSDPGVLYNMAACHQQLGQDSQACALLERVLRVMPENHGAIELQRQLQARTSAGARNSR